MGRGKGGRGDRGRTSRCALQKLGLPAVQGFVVSVLVLHLFESNLGWGNVSGSSLDGIIIVVGHCLFGIDLCCPSRGVNGNIGFFLAILKSHPSQRPHLPRPRAPFLPLAGELPDNSTAGHLLIPGFNRASPNPVSHYGP